MSKAKQEGWFERPKYPEYSSVPHWFSKGEAISLCGRIRFRAYFRQVDSSDVALIACIGCNFCTRKRKSIEADIQVDKMY